MNSVICHKIKSNPNKDKDKVYTPPEVAEDCFNIIKYKLNKDYTLFEPFYGKGAFYNLFGDNPKHYTEIDMGLDFFEIDDNIKTDWVITNPPYSIFNKILDKFFKMKNLKGFALLVNNLTTTPHRLKRMEDEGFYPTDLYIFKIRSWFGTQHFWVFEKLDSKPKVNIKFNEKVYKY